MTISNQHRPFDRTGLNVPPIMFGASALGDAQRVIPDQSKLAICSEWFRQVAPPMLLDTGGTGRSADAALAALGRMLARLEIAPEEVVINVRLGGADVKKSWEKRCRLLSGTYLPKLAAIEVEDNLLSAADSPADRKRQIQSIVDSCQALSNLKTAGKIAGVGIAVRDWRVAQEIVASTTLDWVMLIGGFTLLRHPPELVAFLGNLAERRIAVVLANVFHDGFLLGGSLSGAQGVDLGTQSESSLLAWRKSVVALCQGHGVAPAHAAIQFALSAPGVVSVSINTSHADRVAENAKSAVTPVPVALWDSLEEEGLITYRTAVG